MTNPDLQTRITNIIYSAFGLPIWGHADPDMPKKCEDAAVQIIELLREDNPPAEPQGAIDPRRQAQINMYGYLENINDHLGSMRNALGMVSSITNPKMGTPAYHLQAAEDYINRLYNAMIVWVPDPEDEDETARLAIHDQSDPSEGERIRGDGESLSDQAWDIFPGDFR